jgi:DNA repair protein RadC
MTEKKSIKEWAKEDRPREKMIYKGKAALTDSELLAILLRVGKEGQTAVDVARSLLDSVDNDLIKLSNLTLDDLTQHKGIGKAKAITIMAALELGKRRRAADAKESDEVKNSNDAYERFLEKIEDKNQEHFLVLYLDQSNHPLDVRCISNGGTTHVIADPKIIFKNALRLNATCIVLGHNHPSGNPRPSTDDRKLTQKLVAAGKLLDITVKDHIIIGNERYYSFLDHGEMTF